MAKTSFWGARAAAVAAAVGLLVGTAGVVEAQPVGGVDVAFNIAAGGSLSVPPLDDNFEIAVPDPNAPQLQGSWDPTTGDFVGDLSEEKFTVQITDPLDITIEVSFASTGVSGNIPADGEPGFVEVSGFTYTARNPADPVVLNCTLDAGDVELAATLVPGEPVGLVLTGTVVFPLSPLPGGCALLASLLPQGTNSLPVDLDLRLAQVTEPAPTPTPEPAPTPAPAVAKPAFTG